MGANKNVGTNKACLLSKYRLASSNKTSHLPIKSILKNGNNDHQTFPGEIPAKYHGNSNAALNPHPGCKVSSSTCSVSCGVSTHSGCKVSISTCSLSCRVSHNQDSDCCISSRPGPSCCVRERKRTLSALSARGPTHRSCSQPCSDDGQAGSLTRVLQQRPAAAAVGLAGHSQVTFHPVVERF